MDIVGGHEQVSTCNNTTGATNLEIELGTLDLQLTGDVSIETWSASIQGGGRVGTLLSQSLILRQHNHDMDILDGLGEEDTIVCLELDVNPLT